MSRPVVFRHPPAWRWCVPIALGVVPLAWAWPDIWEDIEAFCCEPGARVASIRLTSGASKSMPGVAPSKARVHTPKSGARAVVGRMNALLHERRRRAAR